MPAGATFRVEVPRASAKFVHYASLVNTAGNYTYLDNQLTNGEPDAVLSVTQNWNPGGGRGVYNNHPVDTVYDAQVEKWAVYNRDVRRYPREPPSTSPSRRAPTSFTVRRLQKLHLVLRSVPTRSADQPIVSFMGTIYDDIPGSRFSASVGCTPLSRSSIQLNDLDGRACEKGKQRTTILGRNLLR